MTQTKYHNIRISDFNDTHERLYIVLPLQIEQYIIKQFSSLKIGLIAILPKLFGYDFWDTINEFVRMQIFKNKNEAVKYAAITYYLEENGILKRGE